jgi:hypothetical protein
MKTDIITINNGNVCLVADLLYARNNTSTQYTEWKYQSQDDSKFRGIIAKKGSEAIGCFGVIPKQVQYQNERIETCGWFADWFVSPVARGDKVGEILLNELSSHLPIIFGHPGPDVAQKLCHRNGYQALGFQSRRRIILRRWSYNWKRKNLINSIKNRFTSSKDNNQHQDDLRGAYPEGIEPREINTSSIHFKSTPLYEKWIQSQPIGSGFTRKYGEWIEQDINIKYFDDKLQNGEKKRSVLMISGENVLDANMWNLFINISKAAGQDYIEIFTTNKKLDELLIQLGAWHIYEPPILAKGLGEATHVQIQAWDRENWTYLAMDKQR